MSEVILAVNKLSKCFSGQMVIDRLSFTINQGECLAIFAPAGAGKTTLIRILSGLDTQDSGQFELFDDSPVTMFQEHRLFPFMTVKDNIFLPLAIIGPTSSSLNNLLNNRYAVALTATIMANFGAFLW